MANSSVHPARGDKHIIEYRLETPVGSPPRAWGQGRGVTDLALTLRFHPTRVGTRYLAMFACASAAVHSHARGDERRQSGQKRLAFGSLPRAWGRVPANRAEAQRIRFTPPMRVGTSHAYSAAGRSAAVHPHERGDETERVLETTGP